MGVVQWCTDLPHLVHLLTFLSLLGNVSPPRVPSRVMVPLSQGVSLVGQMAFFDDACEGCVRV